MIIRNHISVRGDEKAGPLGATLARLLVRAHAEALEEFAKLRRHLGQVRRIALRVDRPAGLDRYDGGAHRFDQVGEALRRIGRCGELKAALISLRPDRSGRSGDENGGGGKQTQGACHGSGVSFKRFGPHPDQGVRRWKER